MDAHRYLRGPFAPDQCTPATIPSWMLPGAALLCSLGTRSSRRRLLGIQVGSCRCLPFVAASFSGCPGIVPAPLSDGDQGVQEACPSWPPPQDACPSWPHPAITQCQPGIGTPRDTAGIGDGRRAFVPARPSRLKKSSEPGAAYTASATSVAGEKRSAALRVPAAPSPYSWI